MQIYPNTVVLQKQKKTKMAEESFLKSVFTELVYSPVNIGLLGVCIFLIYKIVKGRDVQEEEPPVERPLEPLKRQDMTVEQLKSYDGKTGDGRILIAVNKKIFDVTRGRSFYGPGNLIWVKYNLRGHHHSTNYTTIYFKVQ